MNSMIGKRLARLEEIQSAAMPSRERRRFYVSGYGQGDAADFLESCGHDVRDGDIIRQIIDVAPEGGPLIAPITDITAEIRAKRAN